MISHVLDRKVQFVTGRRLLDEQPEYASQWPIKEMQAQLGYKSWLMRTGQWEEKGRACAANYQYARDCALANGLCVDNFPRRIVGGLAA